MALEEGASMPKPDMTPKGGSDDDEIIAAVESAITMLSPEVPRDEKIDAAIAALEAMKGPAEPTEDMLGGLGGGESMPLGSEV